MVLTRFTILALLIFTFACGGPGYHNGYRLTEKHRKDLIAIAGSYLGTPYRFGGTNSNGFDCSGFVYKVYHRALNWNIPRTTETQFKASFSINSHNALPGDLVFFRINGGRIDHVGMMISNYQFIHASKSRGVIISDFSNDYYRDRFSSIRRFR
jgi:cell wall-associated NlpC family hydrolase